MGDTFGHKRGFDGSITRREELKRAKRKNRWSRRRTRKNRRAVRESRIE